MKEISLKPVYIQIPRDVPQSVRNAIAKAEETIRENNNIIEKKINEIIKEINNGN